MAEHKTVIQSSDAYEVLEGSDQDYDSEADSLLPKSGRALSVNSDDNKIQKVIITDRREFGINNLESMLHILKGNIGTGILAMPVALKYAGLWTGFVGVGLIGIIAVHCMHLLVRSSEKLCEKFGVERMDYAECMEKCVFNFYQKERLAKGAKVMINVFLCITQFGFCTVYILFIATNIKQFTEHFVDMEVDVRAYQAVVLVAIVPFCWIKSLKLLAPFSMLANVLTAVGLIIILQYCAKDLPPYTEYPAFADITTLPLFFGIAIYAFEGISLVLPVENKMKHPQDFRGWTGVLNTAMVIVTVLYMAVGFYGYMKFGNAVEGSITLNMPSDYWLFLVLKLMFAVAIFISYGVQFYVPAIILIPPIERKVNLQRPWQKLLFNYWMRTLFVVATFIVSILVPHLDLMISLIGALASSALALIFPPIIDVLLRWPRNLGKYKWRLWKDSAICIFGFFGFLTGTVTTLINIVHAFQNEEP